jgi:general secretion pathway protein D
MKMIRKIGQILLTACISISLMSCDESYYQDDDFNDVSDQQYYPAAANPHPPKRTPRATTDAFKQALNGSTRERRVVGTNNFLNSDLRSDLPLMELSERGEITLNLVDTPLDKAAKAILGDALKKNYSIAPRLQGNISLQTSKPISEKELFSTFQKVLELNGATLQITDSLIQIIPLKGAALRIGAPNQIGARVVAVPLDYISTAEMVRLVEPISGDRISFLPIPNRNTLLVTGPLSDINLVLEAISLFDVDVLEGKSVGLFKLRAAEPEAVIEELKIIFETEEGGSLQNVITFVPSQRLGAIVVITSRSVYLEKAEQWIRDLDRSAGSSQRRPVVYNLQNRTAVELAPIMSEMLLDVSGDAATNTKGTPKVVADDANNAIIVWGNDSEQGTFSKLIEVLDTTPVQVLLEATIAEVTLNDDLNFGLRWFFQKGNFGTTFTDSTSGSTGPTYPGLSLVFDSANALASLNALADVTDVNIVSSPSLMVLDNKEATLQIGDQVPVATQQSQDTSDPEAPVINTISFRDTGIILKVKPRVSSSGRVVLDIEQEVSSVSSTTTSGIDSPTISQRKIKTSVVVTDGQTLALGGLIQQSKNTVKSQVPGLGDIPVAGALFKNTSDLVGKTELLILITPRVVTNDTESYNATNELRRRIYGADGIIKNGIKTQSTSHRILR